MQNLIGRTLDHYRIVERIGAGGMGEVYRAHDERLDRDVAVKVLPKDVAQTRERLDRFEREARAVAKLDHPNILAIHNFGTDAGIAYAVMELLEGESLRQRISSGNLTTGKAVEYAISIAEGLAAAHDKGIIHRDLKPENIFLTDDGRIKILDFGLAKLMLPEEDLTTETPTGTLDTERGSIIGTIAYMAPEQVDGQTADRRSDIFAFGVVLYEMLTGQRPFRGATSASTAAAILKEDPEPISATVPSPNVSRNDRRTDSAPHTTFPSLLAPSIRRPCRQARTDRVSANAGHTSSRSPSPQPSASSSSCPRRRSSTAAQEETSFPWPPATDPSPCCPS
jgi:serine/threonine protein kinase